MKTGEQMFYFSFLKDDNEPLAPENTKEIYAKNLRSAKVRITKQILSMNLMDLSYDRRMVKIFNNKGKLVASRKDYIYTDWDKKIEDIKMNFNYGHSYILLIIKAIGIFYLFYIILL